MKTVGVFSVIGVIVVGGLVLFRHSLYPSQAVPKSSSGFHQQPRTPAENIYFYVRDRHPGLAGAFVNAAATSIALNGGHVAVVGGRERLEGIEVDVATRLSEASFKGGRGLALCDAVVEAVRGVPVRGVSDVTIWSRDVASGMISLAEAVAPATRCSR